MNNGNEAQNAWLAELERLAQEEFGVFVAHERVDQLGRAALERAIEPWGRGARLDYLALLCSGVLWRHAYLVDHQYHRERTAVLLARETLLMGVMVEDKERIERLALEAVCDILAEDEERWQSKVGCEPQSHHLFMVHQFGLEEARTLEASVRFHRLEAWTRKAFAVLLLDRASVQQCLQLGFGPPERLKQEVRRALKALLDLEDLWLDVATAYAVEEEGQHG